VILPKKLQNANELERQTAGKVKIGGGTRLLIIRKKLFQVSF